VSESFWLDVAEAEHGTAEVRGGENPRILEYFRSTVYHAPEDEVPWCAAFVSWVLDQCQLDNPSTVRARDFLEYGTELPDWRPGCIGVLWRGSPTASTGHVGFVISVMGDQVVLLGGNQGDRVDLAIYPRSQVLSYRWPTSRATS
jgi:uncharacterized protein (TIGR02594 family)